MRTTCAARAGGVAISLLLWSCAPGTDPELEVLTLGGDFELASADGSRFRLSDRSQEVKLLYFGYTHCPDACPAALGKIQEVERLLGAKREALLTLLVTVDPARDSSERLREWLDFFGVRGLGLWGSEQELRELASRYGAFFERSPQETAAGYLVDHTTYLFLIDRQGRLRKVIGSEVEPVRIAKWIKQLLREPNP